jgi:hypothetical protein
VHDERDSDHHEHEDRDNLHAMTRGEILETVFRNYNFFFFNIIRHKQVRLKKCGVEYSKKRADTHPRIQRLSPHSIRISFFRAHPGRIRARDRAILR